MLKNKTILVIGAAGQVGSELLRTLQPLGRIMAADYDKALLTVDLANHRSIRELISDTAPDIIINAAAYTAVDKAESEAEQALAINGTAPGILAEEAKARGALLVHYSTDYVFNGKHTQPYRETDVTDPRSVYGETKLIGDQNIAQVDGHYFIFRTSWVYGRYGKNFLLTMQRLAAEREELCIVSDQIGAPTWSRLIAEATAQILAQVYAPKNPLDLQEISGLYHLTCNGACSWFDFATAIVEAGEHRPNMVPIKTEEYPTPAYRPAYSVLDNQKLADTFGLRLPEWRQALTLCMDKRT